MPAPLWWILVIGGTVVVVAGAAVVGNKRVQRRALRGGTKLVTQRLSASATTTRSTPPKAPQPRSGFVKAPDPQVLQRCTASGCYTSKSPKKDCKCPCGGKLHGTGRPARQKKAACAPAMTPQPVSSRPGSGPRAAEVAASRIETALRAHAQASSRCNGGTVSRRTFGDGRVTYTCNTCRVVLAS